jgi:hypothetical protein
MKPGNERMVPASPTHWLLACGLVAALGAAACNGAIDPGAGPGGGPGGPGAAGSTGFGTGTAGTGINPVTGAAGTTVVVPKPPAMGIDVGRISIHRLNNLEYDNTMRDLVGVPGMAQATFQPDEKGEFDNTADAFTMNDARYEQYFNAADTIGEAIFASPALKANILVCVPAAGNAACTSMIISQFAMRAWRRPLLPAELTRLVALAGEATALLETPENSIKHVVKTLLASPQFLYRIEFDPNPASLVARPLDDYELASRLSYLGWSTMPDNAMFALAAAGTLKSDVQIPLQIDRMLADPTKGNTFTESFAGQWLGARDMKSHQVEPTAFKTFDEPLRAAMVTEELMYFNEFLTGALPMTQFFTADVNFVNARLATHYGFPGITSTTAVKMTNTTDSRVGFMGLASFLSFTSFSYRTAPTLRGKWVLLNLLCQSIPTPPANVPKLDTGAAADPNLQSQNVSVRLAAHRAAAACAACHKTLDPIGLGLENFDAIGAYRAKYGDGTVIDPAGVLPDGSMFTSVQTLAALLSTGARLNQLTDCASEKMMTYALSRALGPLDDPYLAQIRTAWAGQGFGLKALMKDVVLNDTFRFRHGEM